MSRTNQKSSAYRKIKDWLEHGDSQIDREKPARRHRQRVWRERCPWCDGMTLGFEGKLECTECGPVTDDEYAMGFNRVA